MKNINKEPLVNLVDRLNTIDNEMKVLTEEYNSIIKELWYRAPSLQDNDIFQQIEEPKVLKKGAK